MSAVPSQLEERIAALAGAVRALEQRVAVLERRAGTAAGSRAGTAVRAVPAGADRGAALSRWTGAVSLSGQTLLVLAGAFVLRAVSDAGLIPVGAGVALGLVYAAGWLLLADRAAPARPRSGTFLGVAALCVAAPLVAEATARFGLLPPAGGIAIVAAFTAAALLVAGRRRLVALAWTAEVAGMSAALAVAAGTGRLSPALLFMILLGAGTLALSGVPGWLHLRWAPALVADVAAIVLSLGAARAVGVDGPAAAVVLDLFLLVTYLGLVAARALRGSAARDFEVIQLIAAVCCGVGGAALVTVRAGAGRGALGAAVVALGMLGYAAAFALARRRRAPSDVAVQASVGLVLLLAGTALLLPRAAVPYAWAGLALAAASAARGRRLALAGHACVLALAAGCAAGELGHAWAVAFTSPSGRWPAAPAALPWAALGMAAVAWLTRSVTPAPRWHRAARCALLAGLALAASALAVGWAVPPLAAAGGSGARLLVAATVRTAVFVAVVILLAWAGRREAWREAGWLAYPLLAALGVQLLLENLARPAAASLVLAFALYGAALILVPRLRRPPSASSAPAPAAPRHAATSSHGA